MGGKFDKLMERLSRIPSDFTYDEAKTILVHLGYYEDVKGKTSGSRVVFYREKDKASIMLHKPHPSNIMKRYAVNFLLEEIRKWETY